MPSSRLYTRVRTIGRGVCRIVSLFVDIPTLVAEADRCAEEKLSGLLENIAVAVEEEEELSDEEKADRQRRYVCLPLPSHGYESLPLSFYSVVVIVHMPPIRLSMPWCRTSRRPLTRLHPMKRPLSIAVFVFMFLTDILSPSHTKPFAA